MNTRIHSKILLFFQYKRASLTCAARLANTVSTRGALWAPGVTSINYKGNNISKYACPTAIIDIARKITKIINFLNFDE